jgi:hypothetical protein
MGSVKSAFRGRRNLFLSSAMFSVAGRAVAALRVFVA